MRSREERGENVKLEKPIPSIFFAASHLCAFAFNFLLRRYMPYPAACDPAFPVPVFPFALPISVTFLRE